MGIKPTVVADAFLVQYFENAIIVAYAGLRVIELVLLFLAYNSSIYQGAYEPYLAYFMSDMHTYTSNLYMSSIFCAKACMYVCKLQNMLCHSSAACVLDQF